jgi:hypothetical protein
MNERPCAVISFFEININDKAARAVHKGDYHTMGNLVGTAQSNTREDFPKPSFIAWVYYFLLYIKELVQARVVLRSRPLLELPVLGWWLWPDGFLLSLERPSSILMARYHDMVMEELPEQYAGIAMEIT